jgi:hypothetical protein
MRSWRGNGKWPMNGSGLSSASSASDAADRLAEAEGTGVVDRRVGDYAIGHCRFAGTAEFGIGAGMRCTALISVFGDEPQ